MFEKQREIDIKKELEENKASKAKTKASKDEDGPGWEKVLGGGKQKD